MSELTLFQKILKGEIKSEILYQDELVFVIRDIHPAKKIHLLIIPVKPIPTVSDVIPEDEPMIGHMFTVARRMAEQFEIAESGYRLIINCKAHGGQEVYHLHMHLLGGEPIGPMVSR